MFNSCFFVCSSSSFSFSLLSASLSLFLAIVSLPPPPDENANLKSVEAGLKADFKLASEDRTVLRAELERLKAMVCMYDMFFFNVLLGLTAKCCLLHFENKPVLCFVFIARMGAFARA